MTDNEISVVFSDEEVDRILQLLDEILEKLETMKT